jgi:hypothetical protein
LSSFDISIIYRPPLLSDDWKSKIQFALEEKYPELKKGRQNATYRILGKKTGVSETEVASVTAAIYVSLAMVLESALMKTS